MVTVVNPPDFTFRTLRPYKHAESMFCLFRCRGLLEACNALTKKGLQPVTCRVETCLRFQMLSADYLVVGAGLHSLAFVDELLAQDPSATFIIVDEHAAPGGHWNDACTL